MKIISVEDKEDKYMLAGVHYTVYAVYLASPMRFMIQVESLPSGPHSVSELDVTVVDQRLSKHWVFGKKCQNKPKILSFHQWANDPKFYESVLEGYSSAQVWREYRDILDREFTDDIQSSL